MKKRILSLALVPVICLALVGALTLGAAATGNLETISAYLNKTVTVTLDGKEQILKDAAGNRVYPITYNGSTYLPVRAISGMLGVAVDWDGATRTVKLGEQAGKGLELLPNFKAFNTINAQQKHLEAKDKKQISGIDVLDYAQIKVEYYGLQNGSISFNTGGKYQYVTFKYYSDSDAVLKVMGDDDYVLWETTVKGGELYKEATVALEKFSQLKFYAEGTKYVTGNWLSIFDAYLT